MPETLRRKRLRRHPAAAARTANEKYLVVFDNAGGFQHASEVIRECRVHPIIGKRLPLLGQQALACLRQIGQPNKDPFCLSTHIHHDSPWIGLEVLPHLRDRHVVDVDNLKPANIASYTKLRLNKAFAQ